MAPKRAANKAPRAALMQKCMPTHRQVAVGLEAMPIRVDPSKSGAPAAAALQSLTVEKIIR